MRIKSARLWLSIVACLSFTVPVALIAAQESTPDTTNFALTATALAGGGSAADLPFAATATALAAGVQQQTATPLANTPVQASSTALPSAEVTAEPTVAIEPTEAAVVEATEVTEATEAAETTEATEEATVEVPTEVEAALTAAPTAASGASASAETGGEEVTAEGTSTLILLIGLGAVLAVGGIVLLRERYQDNRPQSDE